MPRMPGPQRPREFYRMQKRYDEAEKALVHRQGDQPLLLGANHPDYVKSVETSPSSTGRKRFGQSQKPLAGEAIGNR